MFNLLHNSPTFTFSWFSSSSSSLSFFPHPKFLFISLFSVRLRRTSTTQWHRAEEEWGISTTRLRNKLINIFPQIQNPPSLPPHLLLLSSSMGFMSFQYISLDNYWQRRNKFMRRRRGRNIFNSGISSSSSSPGICSLDTKRAMLMWVSECFHHGRFWAKGKERKEERKNLRTN